MFTLRKKDRTVTKNAQYITLNENNFKSEVLEGAEPVLVDFWASWCGPCHMLAPVIEELAVEFEGRAKVGKVDVDQNRLLAEEYGIRSIPTLVFFKDGRVVDQVAGAVTKRVLADKLHALLQPASGEERISSDSYAPDAKTSSDTKGGRDLASPLRRGASSLASSIRRGLTSAINVGCRLLVGE